MDKNTVLYDYLTVILSIGPIIASDQRHYDSATAGGGQLTAATVVIGGPVSATILTLLMLPAWTRCSTLTVEGSVPLSAALYFHGRGEPATPQLWTTVLWAR